VHAAYLPLLFLLTVAPPLTQTAVAADETGFICGMVSLAGTDEAAVGATVQIVAIDRNTVVDADGAFCLHRIPEGQHILLIRRIGLAPVERTVTVRAGEETNVQVAMEEVALEAEGIVVTASELAVSSAVGTASRIDRDAIEHVQASSLADLLELVPGQLAGNPSLSSPQESLLRQVPTTGDAARINALGTALVLDGAPVSNNANLQVAVPTPLRDAASGRPAFASTAGGGVDLRRISPDQIASLEVVRGVPSARHGDLSAGMLLVQTRAGAMQPEFRLRANPTTLDMGTAAGWSVGGAGTGISVTGNLAASQNDPRQTLDSFERLTLQSTWTEEWLPDRRLLSTLRVSGHRTLDERRTDPDDARFDRTRYSRDQGLRAHLSGHWHPGERKGLEISWDVSVDYSEQEGFLRERVTQVGTFPLTDVRVDTTQRAQFGPLEYLSEVTVHGRPLDIYGRLEGERTYSSGSWVFTPVVGTELRYSKNFGRGRQFDPLRPPRMHYSVGDRPRDYRDVPGLTIWSTYGEVAASAPVLGRPLLLHAGLRFDNVEPTALYRGRFGSTLAPRLNLQYEVVNGWALRGGYGRMAKAPSMNFLFPGPRYFDLVNLNYFPQNPDERLLILTTRVVEPDNNNLRSFTNDKLELGVSGQLYDAQVSLTGFSERTRGGLGLTLLPITFEVDRFTIEELREGQPPVISDEPTETERLVRAYHASQATRNVDSYGVEFAIDVPEISLLRTSLHLTGGWTTTRFNDQAQDVDTNALFRTQPPPERIGVYSNAGFERDRLVTSLRFVHRIPEVGFVVSFLAQGLWWDRERAFNSSERPIAYITRDGEFNALTPEQAAQPEFDDLRRERSERFFRTEDPPPLWLFNMRLSKSLPANLQLSFFANNVFAHRPLYERSRSTGFSQRNPPLFFGVELVARL